MFNIIVISCILFIILAICKIIFQLTDFVSQKINAERECKNKLNLLLNLSKGEAALIKYLFFCPTHTAWFPPDLPEVILLLQKNQIKEISSSRISHDLFEINFYKNMSDRLYLLGEDIMILITTHQKEIMSKWKKINYKKFDKYQ